MSIQERLFCSDPDVFVIGEVAQAHDGSLGMAHAYIDAIADAGADAVKFQTHIAEAESSPLEKWRVKFSYEDDTRMDYWKRMEFTEEQWGGLKEHAEKRGLVFMSSPFSIEAVRLLDRIGIELWKVASGEIINRLLLREILETKKPIIFSSGMSPLADLDKVIEQAQASKIDFALLQCTTSYPCPPEKIGLNLISTFCEKYNCPVGLSDHSATIYPSLAAVALGASILEVHVTMSREMFGPDVCASVTTDELRQIVEGAKSIKSMLRNPVTKDQLAESLYDLKVTFGQSLIAKETLEAGTKIEWEHLDSRKPGKGISVSEAEDIVGSTLKSKIEKGEFLTRDILEIK